jgi:peptidoglycan/xylan/chitin deacetylase (PgdA/CDA1 family)
MIDGTLEVIRLKGERLPERARWADQLEARLPRNLARCAAAGPDCFDEPSIRKQAADAGNDLRMRAAFLDKPPFSGRMPVHYHTVPAVMRKMAAAFLGRWQRLRQASWSRFPGWPIDLSADLAADLAGSPGITFSGQTPILLTHDIDSPEGLRNLVDMFLPIEETIGACSANYIVPCAWPPDPGLVEEVKRRGHEIGVHGFDHANRTPFAADDVRRSRLAAGRAFGDRYAAVGYRAPSLVRTAELLADLAPLYLYDSSIPTSGGPFPVPNNGCASARPWKLGAIWEIPLSLPRDGSLRFLGHGPAEIGRLWRSTAETVARSGGVVCLLTHCEERFSGNRAMLETYRSFIEWAAGSGGFEFIRPADLIARLERVSDGAKR